MVSMQRAVLVGIAASCHSWLDPVVPGMIAAGILMVAVSLASKPPPEAGLAPYFDPVRAPEPGTLAGSVT